jgi:hypothetical protein
LTVLITLSGSITCGEFPREFNPKPVLIQSLDTTAKVGMRLLEQTPYGVMKRTVLDKGGCLTLFVDGMPVAHCTHFMLYVAEFISDKTKDAVNEWVERCLLMSNRSRQTVCNDFFDHL